MSGWTGHAAELCRLYVAGLLLAAALGKARSWTKFEHSLTALLGCGQASARLLSLALIAAEGGVALMLLAGGAAAVPAMAAALALFALFAAAVAAALARGRTFSCNCFGGVDRPISGFDLIRNGLLMAACAFYLIEPPRPDGLDLASRLSLIALAVVLLVLSLNLGGLFGRCGGAAPSGPFTVPIGEILPAAGGVAPTGQPSVIVFLSIGCPACRRGVEELSALLPGMARAGVGLFLVGLGEIDGLIEGTGLQDRLVELDGDALVELNPRRAAPAYIFIDENRVALASDFLGDGNWRIFAAQMRAAGRRLS